MRNRDGSVPTNVSHSIQAMNIRSSQPDQIVISDKTRERLGDAFQLRPLDVVSLRGRESNLAIFEVIG
jgi:class 3 adenylate cyclase